MTEEKELPQSNFIQSIINEDKESNLYGGRVQTRFPPEPNGYLHIGHAKSICLNFGLAEKNKGLCNLRFDDTNPIKEDFEYVEAIQEDIKWLGFDWEDRLFYASDYFEKLYEYAILLIEKELAYVDESTAEEIRALRGTLTEPGQESPFRNRDKAESLELFRKMRQGEFAEGKMVLRAKIDMSSPNINLRDPILYRIMHAEHHRTGSEWKIYPMYDYAHPLSDALEGITHSICTLEFEDHRPLYDWILRATEIVNPPKQIEFARLNLSDTVMSKRFLRQLVEEGLVKGWDDPRMPTICGIRRRGFTPEAVKDFCDRIGVAKSNSEVDKALLDFCVREDLNKKADRVMAVLRPLKVVITNYPEGLEEEMEAENNPEAEEIKTRMIPFSREIYIEQDDFMEEAPKKFFRLSLGKEVRLKNAYIIKCEAVVKDENGEVIEVHCTYDPESKSGSSGSGRKVKGTLHWVAAKTALPIEVRLYENLLLEENEDREELLERFNRDSLEILENAYAEPGLGGAKAGEIFQFMRLGYFCVDPDSTEEKVVFNRTVGLRDTWKKIAPQ
jgi:glutaminyl-tRNA synthetase